MPLVSPFDFVDPGNLSGFNYKKTANDLRRERLVKSQEKYAKVYKEAEFLLGKPYLKENGFPEPVVQILAAGMGGSGRGGGFSFAPPIVPSQAGGGAVSEQDIKEEEKKSEELTERITYINSDDYEIEPNTNASSVGDRPQTRIPSIGESRREYISPFGKGKSKEAKEWAKGKRVIGSNRVRDMIKKLARNTRLTSGTKKKSAQVATLLDSIFAHNEPLTSRVLQIFNNADIYFYNTNALVTHKEFDEKIVKKIMNKKGIEAALLYNEIIDSINTHVRDGNRPDKEKLLTAMKLVPTGNLTVGRPGVSTTAILSTTEGREKVRNVLTSIGLNEEESKSYMETLVKNLDEIREDMKLRFGSKDISNQYANNKLKQYLKTLEDSLKNEFPNRKFNFNSSKLKALYIDLMKDITKAKKGKLLTNINKLKTAAEGLKSDIKKERNINPESFIENRIGPITRDVDYKMIESEGIDYPDLDIDYPRIDYPRIDYPSRDPSGLPFGNVFIINPNVAIGLLNIWRTENNIIGYQGRGISVGEPPDPDDPDRSNVVSFETPWGTRMIRWNHLKSFISSIVGLGSGVGLKKILDTIYDKLKGGDVGGIKVNPGDPTTGEPGTVEVIPKEDEPASDEAGSDEPNEPASDDPIAEDEGWYNPVEGNKSVAVVEPDVDEPDEDEPDVVDDNFANNLLAIWKENPEEANNLLEIWKENPEEANNMMEVWREKNEEKNNDESTYVEYQKTQAMSEPSGLLRASGTDPAEASLFLHTSKESRAQQRLWDNFSRVEPGNSLGSMNFNTLRQHNARENALRFKNNYKLPQNPTIVKPFKANPKIQPMFIPHFMSDFGDVVFEDDTPQSDYARRNQLTDERLTSNDWRQYENSNNIYMPEGRLYGFKRQPVMIPEIRNNGYDRFLNKERPSQQRGVVIDDRRTGYYFGGGTMPNDNYDKKPVKQKDPTSNIKNKPGALRFSTRF